MAAWRLGLAKSFSRVPKRSRYLKYQDEHSLQRLISTTAITKQDNEKESRIMSLRKMLKREAPRVEAGNTQLQSLVPTTDITVQSNDVQKDPESIADSGQRKKEKFIPLTRQQLVKGLSNEHTFFSPSEISGIEKLSLSLDTYTSRRFYIQLEELKFLYDKMDPDKDTIHTTEISKKEFFDDEYWFLQKLEMLLDKANYYKIIKSDILKILQSHDVTEGVRVTVDPLNYSVLRIWTRGLLSTKVGTMQRLKHQMKRIVMRYKDTPSYDYYTRVFVAVRSNNSMKLHLKMFKDVPSNELEYLIPDGKVEMSNFDKGFLMSSVFLGTLAIGAKLFTVAANLQLDYCLLGLGIASIIGAKGWIGYKNKRNKYLVNLSRTLYFKTVANNRGVLTLLTDRAEDEEFKEALLGYMFLLSPPNRRGVPGTAYTSKSPQYHTMDTLQQQIEEWLHKTYGLNNITFDVQHAIIKLDQMGLLVRHADNTLSVVPINIALDTLPAVEPLFDNYQT